MLTTNMPMLFSMTIVMLLFIVLDETIIRIFTHDDGLWRLVPKRPDYRFGIHLLRHRHGGMISPLMARATPKTPTLINFFLLLVFGAIGLPSVCLFNLRSNLFIAIPVAETVMPFVAGIFKKKARERSLFNTAWMFRGKKLF